VTWKDVMAGFRDDATGLVTATFKGVPFLIDLAGSVQYAGGMRGQEHNKVKRTSGASTVTSASGGGFDRSSSSSGTRRTTSTETFDPYMEILGLIADAWTVTALLVGPDCLARRDALIAACRVAEPGTLRLPTYGNFEDMMARVNVAETPSRGGLVRLTLTFFKTSKQPFPEPVKAGGEVLRATTQDADDLATAEFLANYDATLPRSNYDSFLAAIGNVTTILWAASAKRSWAMAQGAAFVRELESFASAVEGSLTTPQDLARDLLSLIGQLEAQTSDMIGAFARFGDDFPEILPTTPTREKERANRDSLRDFVRAAGAVADARSSASWTFGSVSAAASARAALVGNLTDAMTGAGTDLFVALDLVRAETIAAITAKVPTNAVGPYTVPRLTSVVELAQLLYGDVAFAADLLARNPSIRHPGFIQDGTVLEVRLA
jgi:prophage DNA circulation protein